MQTATLKEEMQLLEAMKLIDRGKIALPPGLQYLDREGLTVQNRSFFYTWDW